MFGRRRREKHEELHDQESSDEREQPEQPEQEEQSGEVVQEVDVDRVLESDICIVEQAVERYLANCTDEHCQELFAALDHLDDQTALGDAFHGRFGVLWRTSPAVVGATSFNPIAEDLPSPEFQAQVALVKAAKQEVLQRTPETLADLRAAAEELAAFSQ